jgi:hypothetical protein
VSRGQIGRFGTEGVGMVCICCLDAANSTSFLRFLLRRLRHRVADARVLVAIRPKDHPVMSDQSLQRALSADDYVSTLGGAVNECLKAAQDTTADPRAANCAEQTEIRNPRSVQ